MVFPVVTIRHACAPPRLSLPRNNLVNWISAGNGRRRRKSGEETLRGRLDEARAQVSSKGGRETKEDGGGAEASVSSRFTHLTGAKSAKTRGACYRARLNEFGPSVNTRKEKRKREREFERFGWNPRPYISTAYSSDEIRKIRHKATA